MKTDLRYFDNKEDGQALYGNIDNRSYGVLTSLTKNSHSVSVGYQRMLGESPFPTLNGYAPQPYLVNWSAVGFVKPNESSWQLRYDLNFAGYGVPGLLKSGSTEKTEPPSGGSAFEQCTLMTQVLLWANFS
ncbi:Porin-like protein NicP precursor [compost metagenome]